VFVFSWNGALGYVLCQVVGDDPCECEKEIRTISFPRVAIISAGNVCGQNPVFCPGRDRELFPLMIFTALWRSLSGVWLFIFLR
jgi:hypothetical protein